MPKLNDEQALKLVLDFDEGAGIAELRDRYHIGNRALLRRLIEASRQDLIGDESLGRVLIDRTHENFPEDPELRLEAVLSCVNSELKQVTILMLDRQPKTAGDIRNDLSEMATAILPTVDTFKGYCRQTLSPIGFLVSQSPVQDLDIAARYFRLSDAGVRYGQPIAAFSLKYAVDHNMSLYSLFGATSSSGDSRGPYNAARILELLFSGAKTIADVLEHIGVYRQSIIEHLKRLEAQGILVFDTLNCERGGDKIYSWVDGRLPNEAAPISPRLKGLTKTVANWLCLNKEGDWKTISTALGCYERSGSICNVLVSLQEQGLAKAPFHAVDKSEILLLDESAPILDYIRDVRDSLRDGPKLAEMRSVFEEFSRDSEMFRNYLTRGIELYRAISPFLNWVPKKERESEVLEFIGRYQGENGVGPRPSEICMSLGWTQVTVGKAIRDLHGGGYIVREQTGNSARYGLPEKP